MNTLKNCLTCGHCHQSLNGPPDCLRTGTDMFTTRRFHRTICDENFSAWTPRPEKPSLLSKLRQLFTRKP